MKDAVQILWTILEIFRGKHVFILNVVRDSQPLKKKWYAPFPQRIKYPGIHFPDRAIPAALSPFKLTFDVVKQKPFFGRNSKLIHAAGQILQIIFPTHLMMGC